MKRIISMACIFSLLFALTACGSKSNGTDSAGSTAEPSVPQTDEAQADSSVPSSEGHTRRYMIKTRSYQQICPSWLMHPMNL